MAKKLTITVTGPLTAALERYGDRLEVDRICCEALEQACRTLGDADRHSGAMSAAVARFRAQRANIRSRTKEEGFTAGREFVLHQADYETASEMGQLYQRSLREAVDDLAAELKQVVHGKPDPFPRKLPRGASLEEWYQGFLEGAMDVWLRIRAEVEA